MVRYGNLYPKIVTTSNIELSHVNASRNKGFYHEVQEVNSNLKYYVDDLQQMLMDKTYVPSPYTRFIKTEGRKEREIFKSPYYPDRMVQWAGLQVIGPIITKQFTNDTYSAIPGRGIHSCIQSIQQALANDPYGTTYCLQCDVKKYYPSINRDILMNQYEHIFKDPDVLWLISQIIYNADGERGIPIGNYFSQYSGNYHLSAFDHWLKEVKGVKYYWRYMDDIIILHWNKEFLHELRKEIEEYWQDKLDLSMKPNWQVYPVASRGIDFIGFRMFGEYTLLRKSICLNLEHRMVEIYDKFLAGEELTFSEWCSYNSYTGWLLYCDSYRLEQKYIVPVRDYCNEYYLKNIAKGGIEDGSTQECKIDSQKRSALCRRVPCVCG